jgi:hypothetical protein
MLFELIGSQTVTYTMLPPTPKTTKKETTNPIRDSQASVR